MIWLQGALAFAIWIASGVFLSRRSGSIREQVGRLPRAQRGLAGVALFVVGAMVLFGGLAIVLNQGGFTADGMTPAAWFAVTVLGLGFVNAQTMGMAMLVSLIQENVTNGPGATSMNRAQGDSTQL